MPFIPRVIIEDGKRYFLIGGRALLPLIPYDGFLRPLLVLFATGTTLVLLRRTYRKPCFPAALWAVCAGSIFLLL